MTLASGRHGGRSPQSQRATAPYLQARAFLGCLGPWREWQQDVLGQRRGLERRCQVLQRQRLEEVKLNRSPWGQYGW